jgi:hypothetical protein
VIYEIGWYTPNDGARWHSVMEMAIRDDDQMLQHEKEEQESYRLPV